MWFERFVPCKRIDYFATLSTPFLGGQQPVMHGGAGLGRTRAEKVDCISSEVGRIQAYPPPWQSLFFWIQTLPLGRVLLFLSPPQ